jgi:hypothetical protein
MGPAPHGRSAVPRARSARPTWAVHPPRERSSK